VIVHRVDYSRWRGDWIGLYGLLRQIMAAR
jgi:hypothetical protein